MTREVEQFWDDFAQEYHENEQETQAALPQVLRDFLVREKLVPVGSLLDLAGGTGKYFPMLKDLTGSYTLVDISAEMLKLAADYLAEGIQLVHSQQDQFLRQQADNTFDLVLSVMNPGLTKKSQLLELQRVAAENVVIMRVIQTTDQLFSPYEEAAADELMDHYASLLTESGVAFSRQEVVVTREEIVTRDFFRAYFAEDFSPAELSEMTERLFAGREQRVNEIRSVCAFIWW